MAIRNGTDVPAYDEAALLRDLATGMSYDDFARDHDLDPLAADTVVADLKHRYDIDRQKVERDWVWVLADPFDALEGA